MTPMIVVRVHCWQESPHANLLENQLSFRQGSANPALMGQLAHRSSHAFKPA
jgi:hypothetical protein